MYIYIKNLDLNPMINTTFERSNSDHRVGLSIALSLRRPFPSKKNKNKNITLKNPMLC